MASSSASRTQPSNGRSLPDVVVAFQDGQTYSKTKLEEHLRAGFFDRQPPKAAAKSTAKKDDVDYIVRELELPRHEAEKALQQHGGDLQAALRALVSAPGGV